MMQPIYLYIVWNLDLNHNQMIAFYLMYLSPLRPLLLTIRVAKSKFTYTSFHEFAFSFLNV